MYNPGHSTHICTNHLVNRYKTVCGVKAMRGAREIKKRKVCLVD